MKAEKSSVNPVSRSSDLTLTGLLGDFRLLLLLFVTFRLLLMMVYQPLVIDGMERGVTTGGDFLYYHQLGALSSQGLMPFRDWWSEFPPIPSLLVTLIYQIAGRSDNYAGFASLFGLLMLVCDTGNLILVRAIGSRIDWNPRRQREQQRKQDHEHGTFYG